MTYNFIPDLSLRAFILFIYIVHFSHNKVHKAKAIFATLFHEDSFQLVRFGKGASYTSKNNNNNN